MRSSASTVTSIIVAVSVLAWIVHSADHDVFKTCAQISFCSKFRNATPSAEKLFKANLNSAKVVGSTITVPLINSNGDHLVMNISYIADDKYRIIIEELDSQRYHLEHVLTTEPSIQKMNLTQKLEDYAEFSSDLDSIHIRTTPDGFIVDFFQENIHQSTFNGSRFFMDNTNESQAFAFGFTFFNSSFLMGLPEKAQNIQLFHTADGSIDPYRLMNSDNWAYEINSTMAMYGAIPVIYSHGSSTSGLFIHNAAQQWVDIDTQQKSAYVMVECGVLDIFVLLGSTIQDTVRQYTSLTGVSNLPPLWSLGYHQSKLNYYTQDEVRYVINSFNRYNYSVDVIWLDFYFCNEGRFFEWSPQNFSDPKTLLDDVKKWGKKLVLTNGPMIVTYENYVFYTGALERGFLVNDSAGTPYVSTAWPINTRWLDFLNPEARSYYSSFFAYDKFSSTSTIAGFWNDLNEPGSDDTTLEKTIPSDCVQYGNVLHRDVHNIFGLTQVMATYAGLLARDDNTKRPFVLSRSFFAGTQRYAAIWSGDNTADWPYLAASWPMCLTLNLLGLPFCGADVGGFEGIPTDELFIRWYQAGIWLPFLRTHYNIGQPSREPYVWPNETQVHLRSSIQIRYKHLPVWYTVFYRHHTSGHPVIRPLFYNYPNDENTFNINDQLLLGSDIMARIVGESNITNVDVYFPGDSDYWYQISNDSRVVFKGGSSSNIPVDISFIPVFYRAGSIITTKETVRSSTVYMKNDPYTLHILLNKNNTASGELYFDDYESFEFENDNKFVFIRFDYYATTNSLVINDVMPDQNTTGFTLRVSNILIYQLPSEGITYTVSEYQYTASSVRLTEVNFETERNISL